MKRIILLFLLLPAAISLRGASLVEGIVYLRNGSEVRFTDDDRIRTPKKKGSLKAFRDAFKKGKQKLIYRYGEIDSIVLRHPQAREYARKFVPLPTAGWSWVYVETPYITVYVYGRKGYGIASNGGIQVWQKHRTFSQSRVAYYLQKAGGGEPFPIGGANRRNRDAFRERIARYIEQEDPLLAERIRCSDTGRSKTVLMLQEYRPGK